MPPETETRTKTLPGSSELIAWLGVLAVALGRLQKFAKLLNGEPGIACDTAHREGVDRVMARDSKNTRPVAQDNMFALPQDDKASLLQRPDSIKMIDARDLGQD